MKYKGIAGLPPRADRTKLESPIEELLIEALEKYLSSDSEIVPQHEVFTLAGKFRLDFLLTIDDHKIAIECDGADFHDEWRDEWRDALILGSGKVDTIYRFRGKDLHTFLNDCVYLIYHYDPILFNDRYSKNAPQLISDELKQQLNDEPNFNQETNILTYETKNEEGEKTGGLMQLRAERRSLHYPGHWEILFDVANRNPGAKIEQLIAIRRGEMNNSKK
jgi:hypothetical protein